MKTLLAKSPSGDPPRPQETLVGHTRHVLEATEIIINVCTTKNGSPLNSVDVDLLRTLTTWAAVVHDIGKATNVFQNMLRGQETRTHPTHHEVLSALLIAYLDTPLKSWVAKSLGARAACAPWIVSWAIGGHHLRLARNRPGTPETKQIVRVSGIAAPFVFLGDHPDVHAVLNLLPLSNILPPRIGALAFPTEEGDDIDEEDLEALVFGYLSESDRVLGDLSHDERVLLPYARAILIAADVAGSALPAVSESTAMWIRDAIERVLDTQALQRVIEARLQGADFYGFQKQAARSTTRATVLGAGCGGGKTIAAYAWAQHNARGRKLFFCYPTTGTATAGYEDYLLAQTDVERALIHGRSQVDIARLLDTDEIDLVEANQRLDSLTAWSQQVIACTADTVLGLIQNQRRGLFSFPAILGGAFVFDEVHSYDGRLFGALLRFIEAFPSSPVLLMSASLPPERMAAIRAICGEQLTEVGGDPAQEARPRYRLIHRELEDDCWEEVDDTLAPHQGAAAPHVLWICNTVGEAVSVYQRARSYHDKLQVLLYHSRFRYRDRLERQQQVLKAFRNCDVPCLAVATQVCEMSLNISADLMVSALAPFPSLVQRLGRLNRFAESEEEGHPGVCRCLVYGWEREQTAPYDRDEIAEARRITGPLLEIDISQRDLADALQGYAYADELKCYSTWLDGGWESDRLPLRESEPSVTVVLERDVPQIREALRGRRATTQNVAGWALPMPWRRHVVYGSRMGPYPVVGDDWLHYNEETGGQWHAKDM